MADSQSFHDLEGRDVPDPVNTGQSNTRPGERGRVLLTMVESDGTMIGAAIPLPASHMEAMAMAVDSFHAQITSSGTAIKDLVLKLGMKALSGAIIWVPLRSERWTDIVRDGDEIRLHLGSARGGGSETSRPLECEPMTPEPLPPPKISVQLRKEPPAPPKNPLPPREESPTILKRPYQVREEPREPPKIPLPPREESPTILTRPYQVREEPREPTKIPLRLGDEQAPPKNPRSWAALKRPLQLRDEQQAPPKNLHRQREKLREEPRAPPKLEIPLPLWEELPKQSRNQSRATNSAQNKMSGQDTVECPNQ